jgi:hypothetical protein
LDLSFYVATLSFIYAAGFGFFSGLSSVFALVVSLLEAIFNCWGRLSSFAGGYLSSLRGLSLSFFARDFLMCLGLSVFTWDIFLCCEFIFLLKNIFLCFGLSVLLGFFFFRFSFFGQGRIFADVGYLSLVGYLSFLKKLLFVAGGYLSSLSLICLCLLSYFSRGYLFYNKVVFLCLGVIFRSYGLYFFVAGYLFRSA